MKKILTLFLALVACLSLASCSKKYVTDVEASVISKALEEGITTDGGYVVPDESFFTFNIGAPDRLVNEYRIIVAKDEDNQNQIGVFKTSNKKDAKELAKYCQNHVNNEKANYDYNLDAEEAQKLKNAQVNVFGTYVVYTILSPEDT